MIVGILFCSNHGKAIESINHELLSIAEQNKAIAQAYYTAMAEKNIFALEKYLDEDVLFIAPLATVIGKQAFLERVQEFFASCATLTIEVVLSSCDQAVVLFVLDYPAPIGIVEAVALLDIDQGCINKIKLFYDVRLFDKKS